MRVAPRARLFVWREPSPGSHLAMRSDLPRKRGRWKCRASSARSGPRWLKILLTTRALHRPLSRLRGRAGVGVAPRARLFVGREPSPGSLARSDLSRKRERWKCRASSARSGPRWLKILLTTRALHRPLSRLRGRGGVGVSPQARLFVGREPSPGSHLAMRSDLPRKRGRWKCRASSARSGPRWLKILLTTRALHRPLSRLRGRAGVGVSPQARLFVGREPSPGSLARSDLSRKRERWKCPASWSSRSTTRW
ncbi:hypothetical protein ACVJGD_009194 [Bradyrhizobium sp. USDA 10063]